jgi:hypothetical protein
MPNDFTNLMPPERQRSLSRDYTIRLSVLALWFIATLAVVAGILTIPTYVYLTHSAEAKQTQLTAIEAKSSATNEANLTTRLAALSHSAEALSKLGKSASVSSIIRTALAIPRSGIAISGLAYTPLTGKTPSSLTITGTAATRDALRNYQIAIQNTSFAKAADLPVSAYAKDSNIPFSISITLNP